MSRERTSEYQVPCPKCREFFAWHHVCQEKKRNRQLIRGSGKNQRRLHWVQSSEEIKPTTQGII